MPSKADPGKQASFLNETLRPLIEKAKAGVIELFFMDASHFVMGGVPGRLWGKVRLWISPTFGFLTKKSVKMRYRFFLGYYNLSKA